MIFSGCDMATLTATIRFCPFAVRFPNASRQKMTACPQNCGITVILWCNCPHDILSYHFAGSFTSKEKYSWNSSTA